MSSADGGPGRREVAYRLFAAEFDDADYSYSESDEERAPNYVVTPTGLRVNRLFAAGVLTEVERVNEDVLRGRVVDPSGAFVTYAGQYQPDEMAFLERTDPPAFVALTGKARTFQPEDSDRVFTSVRPESVNVVDADTRDRWTVSAAEATLERVSVLADALELDARGDDLRAALLAAGVSESLAAGVPLAIDHYGTTPAYLDALRRLALDALELVAGERDEVRSLEAEPDEEGPATVGPIPDVGAPTVDAASVERASAPAESASDADATEVGATESDAGADDSAVGEADAGADDSAVGEADAGADDSAVDEADSSTGDSAGTDSDAAESEVAGTDDAAPSEGGESTDDETAESAGATADAGSERTGSTATAGATDAGGSDSDDLGDFEDTDTGGLGDFEDTDTGDTEDATHDAGTGAAESADDVGMYELDEEERREVEEEYGTEFESGADVGEPGEAGIDVPDADDLLEESDESEAGAPAAETDETGAGETVESEEAEPDESGADETDESGADETDESGAADDVDDSVEAGDVDVESAAVEAMDDLDDGDGAPREEVVAAVVEEYGVAPDVVEDAIQSALMSGQCYEPTEDRFKAI